MKLLADGGSTKVVWVLTDNDKEIGRCITAGLNPSLLEDRDLLRELMLLAKSNPRFQNVTEIEYYGAGCTVAASPRMEKCLRAVFPEADIVVGSDIIGAAKVLLGNEEGIACILGTGANSCLWNGKNIVRQTPALGFILGDEGSGAVLGKLFINALYKGVLPDSVKKEFESECGMDVMGVIEHVYRMPQPNRWLASLSPFIAKHLYMEKVEEIVSANLEAFILRNILPYGRLDLPVNFVGSIAHYYEPQLRAVAEKHGVKVGKILKSPL